MPIRNLSRGARPHVLAGLVGSLALALALAWAGLAAAQTAAPSPFEAAGRVDPSDLEGQAPGPAIVVELTERFEPEALVIEDEPYCPVPGSEFVNSWGAPRSGGRRHKGVDMMAPHGADVLTPVAGVVRSSSSRLGGIGFYLDAADGTIYFGGHLRELLVTGPVEAGQVIGRVGSTGNASYSGPHLHFEIHTSGYPSARNPYPFVREWCAEPVVKLA